MILTGQKMKSGVRQAAFFGLFQMVAPAYAARASDALIVFQVIFILTCATDIYWYISYKRPENEATTVSPTSTPEAPALQE
jgi:hypothetical protein